jgi:hypothetical protein
LTKAFEYAGRLNGLDPDKVNWKQKQYGGDGSKGIIALMPNLEAEDLSTIAANIRLNARKSIKTWPVDRVVDAIDQTVSRLLDRTHPVRKKMEAVLPIVTGYDQEMIRIGLTGYLKTFKKPQLQRFIAEDFPNPGILDKFQPLVKGGFGRAFGPDLLAHIWAGNVPGLPLWTLTAGLLVKAGSIGKVATAEPFFAGWFIDVLAEVEPELANTVALVWWQGGNTELETILFKESDVALAYGGDAAISALAALAPASTRFLAHGHKISFGLIGKEALDPSRASSTARKAAYDVVRYDQQGCFSPHVFFVEKGGLISPEAFGSYLAQALASYEEKFPRRPLSLAESSSLVEWRMEEEVRLGGKVIGPQNGCWTVSIQLQDRAIRPSGLNRTIRIVAIDDLAETPILAAPFKTLIQTVAIATTPERLFRLASMLGEVGVTRVTALGDMISPEAGWHHDGRFNLLDLVRITEIEARAETAAEGFACYAE